MTKFEQGFDEGFAAGYKQGWQQGYEDAIYRIKNGWIKIKERKVRK